MPISFCSTNFDRGHVIHSAPISPLAYYAPESSQGELNQSVDLLDNILSFLDQQNSFQSHLPSSSPCCTSADQSTKKWIEVDSTSPITIPSPITPSPLRIPTINFTSTTPNGPLSPVSIYSHVNSKEIVLPSSGLSTASESLVKDVIVEPGLSCTHVVTDLTPHMGPEHTSLIPALPERSPVRMLKQQRQLGLNASSLSNGEMINMPRLKKHARSNSQTQNSINEVPLATFQQKRIQRRAFGLTPSLSEFNFLSSPINETTASYESPDLTPKDKSLNKRQFDLQFPKKGLNQCETSSLLQLGLHQSEDADDPDYQLAKMNKSASESGKLTSLILTPSKSPSPFLCGIISHCRSQSFTHANSSTSNPANPYTKHRYSASSIAEGTSRDAQCTAAMLRELARIKNRKTDMVKVKVTEKGESVASSMRKHNPPGITLGTRRFAEKWELLNACRVIGTEVRLLTVRRRSLTGTRYEWLVVDNGMAVRGNTNCGRFVLRCLGESDGKVDFFTAEGIPIFRFQRTVGSTRTATLIDGVNRNIFFGVRDGSWDCSVHWEVSLFNTKDQVLEKLLVTGDDQMQSLNIKQRDQTIGTIRVSGDHEYILKVFPNKNWCITTALATFFDEWRAARVGLAL